MDGAVVLHPTVSTEPSLNAKVCGGALPNPLPEITIDWLVSAMMGVTEVMTGCGGAFTVKLTEFDAPPPGDGLVTMTA